MAPCSGVLTPKLLVTTLRHRQRLALLAPAVCRISRPSRQLWRRELGGPCWWCHEFGGVGFRVLVFLLTECWQLTSTALRQFLPYWIVMYGRLGENQSKMKRRRAAVVHANWDSVMTKWSGSQSWWETSKGWDRFFVSTAEEICRRTQSPPSRGKTGNSSKCYRRLTQHAPTVGPSRALKT